MKNNKALKEIYNYYKNGKLINVINHLNNKAQPYIAFNTYFTDNMCDAITLYATPYSKNRIMISDWNTVDSDLPQFFNNYPEFKDNKKYKEINKLEKLYKVKFNQQREFCITANMNTFNNKKCQQELSKKITNLIMFIEDTFVIRAYQHINN